jgi:hypothetical protein
MVAARRFATAVPPTGDLRKQTEDRYVESLVFADT